MTPSLTQMVVHQTNVCPGFLVVCWVDVAGQPELSIDQHPGLVEQGGACEAEAVPPTWPQA